jgi:2-keto-4-pentenoate hydratase/2-oxohepta-3-ene-1,7-dioic acid hydratase in catechol pathway
VVQSEAVPGDWDEAARRVSERILFQLASAEIEGDVVVLVRHADGIYRLDQLVGREAGGAAGINGIPDLLPDWDMWLDRITTALGPTNGRDPIEPDAVHWRVPLRPPTMVCIGSNYHAHVGEMHRDEDVIPKYPYSFLVPARTAVSATEETVTLPQGPTRFDWEGELGVVIGRTCRALRVDQALGAVAGYVVVNDLSVRDFAGPNASAMGVDWVMSKAYDGFKPIGPFLTPSRFVDDPQNLAIRTWVNGNLKQDGNSGDMIFTIAEIIAHLSAIMTLEPGVVIATGTPDGVGHGQRPPEYLERGDDVIVEIGGLGVVETHLA